MTLNPSPIYPLQRHSWGGGGVHMPPPPQIPGAHKKKIMSNVNQMDKGKLLPPPPPQKARPLAPSPTGKIVAMYATDPWQSSQMVKIQ